MTRAHIGWWLLAFIFACWPGITFANCSLGTGWELVQYESFSPFENPPVVAAIGIRDKAIKPTEKDEDQRPYILRFAIFDKQCRVIFRNDYRADDTKFSLENLRNGDKFDEVIHLVEMDVGGSDCGFRHHLFLVRPEGVTEITPLPLHHPSQGGLFVGVLGAAKGSGVALWVPMYDGDSHYGRHTYRISYFGWNGVDLRLIEQKDTKEKVEGDALEKGVGLPTTRRMWPDHRGGC